MEKFILILVRTFFINTDSLESGHILELSKRIENRQQLMDLGIKALKPPDFRIRAALYGHKDSIQDAAHEIIRRWSQQQPTQKEAYALLCS